MGVYADGTILVGKDVGLEVDKEERPLVSVKCPGLNNLSMQEFREGWDSDGLSDEEVVVDCIQRGDYSQALESLIIDLLDSKYSR